MTFRILSLTLCTFMLHVTSPAGAQAGPATHGIRPWARVPNLIPRMMDHGVAEEVFFRPEFQQRLFAIAGSGPTNRRPRAMP